AAAAASSPTPFLGYGGSPWAAAASGDRGVELINLLRQCAFDVDAGSLERADACLARIAGLLSSSSSSSASSASPTGGGGGGGGGQATRVHRLATIFTDALARRLLRRPLPGAYEALLAPAASSDPLLVAAARRHFFDLCPFLKLAFLTSNQAILEQMEGERVVHIVDLAGPAADPAQWLALLRALRARPEGPPHLRITAVHDDPDALHRTSALLSKEADAHDMSFQFHPVLSRLDALDFDSLRVKTGEALAVSSVLQLHSLLPPAADSNSTAPLALRHAHHLSPGSFGELLERELSLAPTPPHSPRRIESFLSGLLALAPKIVVVTEQEANHNGAAFCERFSEALYYYAAMFDCLETTAPRSAAEWGRVERLLLGEQIRNIVACEGAERRERHE
ncbi:scarecrow-like protein 3, partial [Ananas comosus]|uniref:Scarecrow-like protein 3 n=1 Tax=Ananas comosus TaxID=4615 RepID=A0A6P5EEK3_ANACO